MISGFSRINKLSFIVVVGVTMTLLGIFKQTDKKNETLPAAIQKADPHRLRKDVLALTSTSVPRNYQQSQGLEEAASYIRKQWEAAGLKVEDQKFVAQNRTYKNVVTTFGPATAPRIVIGAHYDVADSQPGADDNASGVAGLLELGRLLRARLPELKHRIDLVAYCLEEAPFFGTSEMGSAVHAKSLKRDDTPVELMMSLEMIGYFSDEPHSQNFPVPELKKLYPSTGNFISVIGDLESPLLVQKVAELMRKNSRIEVHSLHAPRSTPGVSLSDHRSYWEQGYPAVMITDTAFFRNPHYHTRNDTPDTLNYEKMAEVVEGVYGVSVSF